MKRRDYRNDTVTIECLREALSDPDSADKLLQQDKNVLNMAWDLLSEGDHRACALLVRAAHKKSVRERLNQLREQYSPEYVRIGLCSQNPKLRKNTAKLIGLLGNNDDSECLINALQQEKVRIVIPSLLLALGAISSEDAHKALLNYRIHPAENDAEVKHEKEEQAALSKAISSYERSQKHRFIGFNGITLQLICAVPMGKYIAEDCMRFGIETESYSDSVVTVKNAEWDKLSNVRSFREILIPLDNKTPNHEKLRVQITDILKKTHECDGRPFRYRIEYRGSGDRKDTIAKLNAELACDELINSVSDYEFEVRFYENGNVKLKLCTYDDTRFAYRKAALPASISPANAASVMSYARRYFTESAVVLDMCCGSGTMLFERDKALPCKRIMGVDISEKAISAAKENAKSANPKALFYRADCRRFTLRIPVDEIISNLPFGNRVGTHKENESLYASIFERMNQWLKPDGIAVLYTMEAKLLLNELKNSTAFELLDMIKTEAGGLMPAVVILRKRK